MGATGGAGTGHIENRGTKKARREAAREQARLRWAREAKARRRKRWYVQGGIALGIIAVVAIAVGSWASAARTSSIGPVNMASDGVLITGDGTSATVSDTAAIQPGEQPTPTDEAAARASGVATIDVYLDYQCPYCAQFETTNAEQIEQWVTAGYATLEIHPIAILDSSSQGTRYSTRAANAAACVADYDPDHFLAVNAALFAQQPAEGTSGLSDDELRTLVAGAGSTDEDVAACITSRTFETWVGDATDRATSSTLANSSVAKLTSTPTVLVDGLQYTGANDDASAFLDFVSSTVSAATPTPTPTPTSTPTPAG